MKTNICVVNRCDPICAKKQFYGTALLPAEFFLKPEFEL